jgi:CRISPR-associated protein Cmr1
MRKISDDAKQIAAQLQAHKGGERITQTRRYKLITPLFGGGVKPRETDESKLVRETEIRGQLRFWWRAMRGDGSSKQMYQRESQIFGSADEKIGQSKISVRVRVDDKGRPDEIFETKTKAKSDWEKIAYAAFPLQPEGSDRPKVRVGVKFTLEISFPPDLRAEIEAALWAWETFGGVGGRTRRGFGAVSLIEAKENGKDVKPEKYAVENIEKQLREDLQKHLLPNKNCDLQVSHLTMNSVFKFKKARNEQTAWENSIEKLRRFRQFRRNKDTSEESPYGESQWSEPNAIRFIEGRRRAETMLKFPRAEFGLPLIFHFPQGMPRLADFTLNLKEHERLASPLILRPLQCADGAVSLALILDAPRARDQELEITSIGIRKDVEAKLTMEEARELTEGGLRPLNGNADVLQAFLDFFAADELNVVNQPTRNNRNDRRRFDR